MFRDLHLQGHTLPALSCMRRDRQAHMHYTCSVWSMACAAGASWFRFCACMCPVALVRSHLQIAQLLGGDWCVNIHTTAIVACSTVVNVHMTLTYLTALLLCANRIIPIPGRPRQSLMTLLLDHPKMTLCCPLSTVLPQRLFAPQKPHSKKG